MNTNLRDSEAYRYIENYSVKCRLYLNDAQKQIVDDILYGIKFAYNTAMYDMRVNHNHTKEWTAKDGNVLHYPDFTSLQKKEYLDELRAKNPAVNTVPAVALSGKNGIFNRDMRNAFEKCYVQDYKDEHNDQEPPKKHQTISVEKAESNRVFNKKLKSIKTNDKKLKKKSTPSYYSKSNTRMSYTYQDTLSKFKFDNNPNVIYADLSRLGLVKIRGFNQRLRFQSKDADTELVTFEEYCAINKKNNKKITIAISKDNCGDYYIILKLNAFKPFKNMQLGEVGVDVGEITSATLSNGVKYESLSSKKYDQKYDGYNRKLSRRQGWKNEAFRDEYKKLRESGETIQPSKRYKETELKLNRTSRKKTRRRNDYYNKISYELATQYKFVATETLSVINMVEGKNRETEKEATRKSEEKSQ